MNTLAIKNLHVAVAGAPTPSPSLKRRGEILRGVSLTLKSGEVHVLMGPNASGKSTLAMVLAGHSGYKVTRGSAVLGGKNLLEMKPEERAKRGLFVAFQHPVEVSGVPMRTFLRTAVRAAHGTVKKIDETIERTIRQLGFGSDLLMRNLNEGLSGGEKKRAEIVQLAALRPRMAVLDEPDSGLDLDALKAVFRGIGRTRRTTGLLVITHNPKIAALLKPDRVHVMVGGRIVRSGDRRLASAVARKGFGQFVKAARMP